ncbi:hypothetical protein SDC9_63713 [bioreactor metagenome]|uniref:Uncharacterized protein n=1 Tax=bioreactor metagenome TaxID=1076179 RepID=A0A644XME8_9ZZZZ
MAGVNAGEDTEKIAISENEELVLPPVSGLLMAFSQDVEPRVVLKSASEGGLEKKESPGF